jgi:hypothetical protein
MIISLIYNAFTCPAIPQAVSLKILPKLLQIFLLRQKTIKIVLTPVMNADGSSIKI